MPLDFSYDESRDQMTIEGVRYSGALFRDLGAGLPIGRWFRIVHRAPDGNLIINAPGSELQAEFTDKAGAP